jgi:cytidine deaminase
MMIHKEMREKLEEVACSTRDNAYAPYSSFAVGAAVLAGSGAIYRGANVENASYGLTICAERTALASAASAGERDVLAVAVCTESGVTPCGACRQFIREFAVDCPIFLVDANGNRRETSLQELLPQSFGKDDLDD